MQPLLYSALGKALIKRTRDGGVEFPEAGIWRLAAIFVLIGGLAIVAETAASIPDGPHEIVTAGIPNQAGEER